MPKKSTIWMMSLVFMMEAADGWICQKTAPGIWCRDSGAVRLREVVVAGKVV
jgi:hypothetical protein